MTSPNGLLAIIARRPGLQLLTPGGSLLCDARPIIVGKTVEGSFAPESEAPVTVDCDGVRFSCDGALTRLEIRVRADSRSGAFWGELPDLWVFGTSLHDVARLAKRFELNHEAIADYASVGVVHGPEPERTLVNGVSQVPPGYALTAWPDHAPELRPEWTPFEEPTYERTRLGDASEIARTALRDEMRLASAGVGRVACLLSGGLDSAVVASIACQELRGTEVVAISVAAELMAPAEVLRRDELSRALGVRVLEVPNEMTLVPTWEQLNLEASFPTGALFSGLYETARSVAREAGVGAIFSGEGGDELCATSQFHLFDVVASRRWAALPTALGVATVLDQGHAGRGNSMVTFVSRCLSERLVLSRPGRLERWVSVRVAGLPEPPFVPWNLAGWVGESFADAIRDRDARVVNDLRERLATGWSLGGYRAYRNLIEVPQYEMPYRGPNGEGPNSTSPIASLQFARAAMSVRLEDRNSLAWGFYPKPLLREIVRASVPLRISAQPKVGASDLFARVAHSEAIGIRDLLESDELQRVGISPNPGFLAEKQFDRGADVHVLHLALLALWLRGFRRTCNRPPIVRLR